MFNGVFPKLPLEISVGGFFLFVVGAECCVNVSSLLLVVCLYYCFLVI